MFIFRRIPKKSGDKEAKQSSSGSGSVLPKAKPNVKTTQYNNTYGKRIPKKSFEDELFKAMTPSRFDVMDVISSMKTLKKDEKKDNIVPKDEAGKKPQQQARPPQRPPNYQQQQQQSQDQPHPHQRDRGGGGPRGGHDLDPELRDLLSQRVRGRNGREFDLLKTWKEAGLQVFKCLICQVQVDGRPNLFTHLGGHRHNTNKVHFTFLPRDDKQSRVSRPSDDFRRNQDSRSGGAGGSSQQAPHFRNRDQEKPTRVDAPWTFSPSEVCPEQDDRPDSLPGDMGEDNIGMDDDFGYDDHEPPPPVAASSSLTRSVTPPRQRRRSGGSDHEFHGGRDNPMSGGGGGGLSLPQPVPSLPKPVPALQPTNMINRNIFGILPSNQANPSLFNSNSNSNVKQEDNNMNPFAPVPSPMTSSSNMNMPFVPPQDPVPQIPGLGGDDGFGAGGVSPPRYDGSSPPRMDHSPPPRMDVSPMREEDLFPEPPMRVEPADSPEPPKPVPHPMGSTPMPVPPPSAGPPAKLTLSALKHLPPSMSVHDKVVRSLNTAGAEGDSVGLSDDWQRAREARGAVGAAPVPAPEIGQANNDVDKTASGDGRRTPQNQGDEPYEPGDTTPVWNRPSNSTTTNIKTEPVDADTTDNRINAALDDFKIDTTRSFFEASSLKSAVSQKKLTEAMKPKPGSLKLKSISTLLNNEAAKSTMESTNIATPYEKPGPASSKKNKLSKASADDSNPGNLSSFLDKVIQSLKKKKPQSGPSMQLPSMDIEEDDTPLMPPAPPPLPDGPAPPLPPMPGTSSDLSLDLSGMLLDDDMVLQLVSELDKEMTEEEKLAKAKEKLGQILQFRKKHMLAAAQRLTTPSRQPPLQPPVPGYRPGPRSRMAVPPPIASMPVPPPSTYRAGPRSRMAMLNPGWRQPAPYQPQQPPPPLAFGAPPPPPPPEPVPGPSRPKESISETDISSFMSEWTNPFQPSQQAQDNIAAPPQSQNTPSGGGGEPAYSSALAKLRAKKAARAAASSKSSTSATPESSGFMPPPDPLMSSSGGPPQPPPQSLMSLEIPAMPSISSSALGKGSQFSSDLARDIATSVTTSKEAEAKCNQRAIDEWQKLIKEGWSKQMEVLFFELSVSTFSASFLCANPNRPF